MNTKQRIASLIATWTVVIAIICKIVFVAIPQATMPTQVRISYAVAFGFFLCTAIFTVIQVIEIRKKWHFDRSSLLRRDGQREQREAHKADYLRLHWLKIACMLVFLVCLVAMNVLISFSPPST